MLNVKELSFKYTVNAQYKRKNDIIIIIILNAVLVEGFKVYKTILPTAHTYLCNTARIMILL